MVNTSSRKQLAVIEDLFIGELDEQQILDKHGISRNTYNKWQADERFIDQLNRRIERAHRAGQLIIARFAPLAAAKLVALTESQKEETARRACLDIISLPRPSAKEADLQKNQQDEPDLLSPETAARLLNALAEET
jgi:hypothetical protein